MSFESLFEFEEKLAQYTGAPYAIVTDGCTNAIELCMRYDQVTSCSFTPYTYLSVPMLMHRLGIEYQYHDHAWQRWVGEYPFVGTRIWDSARRLEPNMYRPGQMQCLSFGWSKPMQLGKGGVILLDDADAYAVISQQRADGRDLRIPHWPDQKEFQVGWHYCPTLELCAQGIEKLALHTPQNQQTTYPDLRTIFIKS